MNTVTRFVLTSFFLLVASCDTHDEVGAVTAALSDGSVDAPLVCPPGTNVILGTEGDDILNGTLGDDCILGLGGNDEIHGAIGIGISQFAIAREALGGTADAKVFEYVGNLATSNYASLVQQLSVFAK